MIARKIYDLGDFNLLQHRVLKDNYNYILIHKDSNTALVIDPSEARTTKALLNEMNVSIDKILLTHHHPDHVGGVSELTQNKAIPVYGFSGDSYRIPQISFELNENSILDWQNLKIKIVYAPGHTMGHIMYYINSLDLLFCGDVIFTLGCGRLFEGTHENLLSSLSKIKGLPLTTLICCAHEYTLLNAPFALKVDPKNAELIERVEKAKINDSIAIFNVPSTLADEVKTNPFLRFDVVDFKSQHQMNTASDLEFLTYLRKMRNTF